MTKFEVENAIYFGLFKNVINSLDKRLSDKGLLLSELKYNENEINKSLANNFETMVGVLQNTVDKFYSGYYEVDSFIPFSLENLENFENTLAHNRSLVNSMKKLLAMVE